MESITKCPPRGHVVPINLGFQKLANWINLISEMYSRLRQDWQDVVSKGDFALGRRPDGNKFHFFEKIEWKFDSQALNIHYSKSAKLFPGIVNLFDRVVEFEDNQNLVTRAFHRSFSQLTVNIDCLENERFMNMKTLQIGLTVYYSHET